MSYHVHKQSCSFLSSDAKVLEILEQFTDTLYTKEFIKMAQELTLRYVYSK